MPKSLLVAKREYLKVIRKPSFWISTLILPVVMAVLTLISGYSSASVETKLQDDIKQLKQVLVLDESNLLNPALITSPFQITTDKAAAIAAVKEGTANAFINYAPDVATTHNVQIYAQDRGLISNSIYSDLASTLLKQNLLLGLNDATKVQLYGATLNVTQNTYKQGVETKQDINTFIVPVASVIIYIALITFAASYLLLSVSEEKENRVIETVLSIIKPRQLITGKIIGQIIIVITQLVVLVTLVVGVIAITQTKLPFDITQIHVTLSQLVWGIFYLLCGFIIMANIMVGVGAAMPTYKEAQSFSSVFIILSFLPIYFAALILAEPSGTIAKIASYFPMTAPMILMFRNALGELSLTEQVVSTAILLAFIALTLWLAFKLFEFGSLEYSRKISLRSFIHNLRS